ncbi:MAG: FAD-dependent oxidoreductase [Anaerolineae bacterium]|nr:FAD-dependent oxidoreductase [Anaerolineae bacterium]
MPPNEDVFPVVVVGSGLAGLSAAIHLAARDVPPLLLEADSEWAGGRLCGGPPDTFEYQGRVWTFPTEHGVHALWGNYDNMRALFNRFIDVELIPSPGEEWIDRIGTKVWVTEAGSAVRRTWIPAPFHYLQILFTRHFWTSFSLVDLLSFPGFMVSMFLTAAFDPICEEIAWDGLMIEEYFRGWTRNLRVTFEGLARNLLAAPLEEITLTGFIAALRFFTILRRDAWCPHYFPGNPDAVVVQPLIAKIEELGGMVMLGTRVETVEHKEHHWRVVVEDAKRGQRSVLAKHIILAVDPPAAKKILCGSPDTSGIADTMNFPAGLLNATVRLWFDKQPRVGSPGGMFTGDCFADNFFWMHRLHREFLEWGSHGGSIIEMHLYASEKELNQIDQALITRAAVDVFRIFPTLRGHLVHASVRHNEPTQTRFRVPTAETLHVKTPWEGIYACGDWVGYGSPAMWMERSVVTGIAAANCVLGQKGAQPFEIIPVPEPELLARVIGAILRVGRQILRPFIHALGKLNRTYKDSNSRFGNLS